MNNNTTTLVELSAWGWVSLYGADTASFLQAQTTNDVFSLKIGQGQYSAILDRKANVLAWTTLHRTGDDSFWLVLEKEQIPGLLERLEAVHFSEDVTWMSTEQQPLLSLHGAESLPLLKRLGATWEVPLHHDLWFGRLQWNDHSFQAIRRSLSGEPGVWLAGSSESQSALHQALLAFDNPPIVTEVSAMEPSRIQAGLPAWGNELTPNTMLANTGADAMAYSATKGCFPGQEILSKIASRGSAPKGLIGILGVSDSNLPLSTGPLDNNGQRLGDITSVAWSDELNRWIGLAVVNRECLREVLVHPVVLSGQTITLTMLPLVEPKDPESLADSWYQEALSLYASTDSPEVSAQAIELLRNALVWRPDHTDTLEMLGVMLSRLGTEESLAEAIAMMHRMVELDPTAVMPHTNLSVFYMQQGNKDAAEDEKAKATVLAFQNAAREKQAEQQAEKAEAEAVQQKLAELESKILMFKEVLEIDPDDALAHYGLGSAYLELERCEDALPLLQRSVELQPNHTPSHLALSQALVRLESYLQAGKAIEQGIVVATQKGDLMPLKSLEQLQYKVL